jgi:hypothetical protein
VHAAALLLAYSKKPAYKRDTLVLKKPKEVLKKPKKVLKKPKEVLKKPKVVIFTLFGRFT